MFSIIIAILAFFIAMVALWLTSETAKKIENQNEKFVRAHVKTLREELREMDKKLDKTSRMMTSNDEAQSGLDKRLNEHTEALKQLRTHLAHLSEQVDLLDRSIPSRYRVRVAKDESKTPQKPSIQ